MVKKVSKATLDRIAKEGGSRILLKKRNQPEPKPSPPAVIPPQENITQFLKEFRDQILQEIKQPVQTQPIERVIRVGNIRRDSDDRISAADFTITVHKKDLPAKRNYEVIINER